MDLTRAGEVRAGDVRSVAILMFLNMADAIFTLVFLQLGWATELNPVMRAAFEASPLAFLGLKVFVVNLGAWVLWRCRAERLAGDAMRLALCAYAAVVMWHVLHAVRVL